MKKKRFGRITAIILCAALIFAMMSAAAFADDTESSTSSCGANISGCTCTDTNCGSKYICLECFLQLLINKGTSSDSTITSTSVDGSDSSIDALDGTTDGVLTVEWNYSSFTFTNNTTGKVNNENLQYYIGQQGYASALSSADISISNVNFEYDATDFTVGSTNYYASTSSSGYSGSNVVANAQLYFRNKGDLTVTDCDFDAVVLTHWGNDGSSADDYAFTDTITGCDFSNITNFALKDIKGKNVTVTGCTFTDCGGGILLSAGYIGAARESVTISDNTFTNCSGYIANTETNGTGIRGLIYFSQWLWANNSDYSSCSITIDSNTATGCTNPGIYFEASSLDISKISGEISGLLTSSGLGFVYCTGLSGSTYHKTTDIAYTDGSGTDTSVDTTTSYSYTSGSTTYTVTNSVPTYYTVKYVTSDGTALATKYYFCGTTTDLLTADDVSIDGYSLTGWTNGGSTFEPGASVALSSLSNESNTITLTAVLKGEVSAEAQSSDSAPEVTASVDADALAEALLTDTEKAAVEAGGDAVFSLIVTTDEDDTVDADDISLADALAEDEGLTIGKYLDISLYLTVTDASGNIITNARQITDTNGVAYTISITVPDELLSDGRTYYLIHVHDGEASVIAETTGESFTFETTQFSTYAIAYAEETSDDAAATGDSGIGLWIVIAALAGLGLAGISLRHRFN